MSKTDLKELVSLIPGLELSELRALEMSIRVAIDIRTQGQLSTEDSFTHSSEEEGPGLNDQALAILESVDTYELSLADQALLGALILSEGYHQDVFSSRDVNDIIEESGRPRIAHITSAISGLTDRAFLTGTTKSLSLSKEGRAKARGLIGMMRRKAA
ncbi:MAG: hypothetical protein AAGF67_05165 [Verrucomicrobiota bacterium]